MYVRMEGGGGSTISHGEAIRVKQITGNITPNQTAAL